MKLVGEAALKEARRIAKDHHMYIVSNPRGTDLYLLYRQGEERGRGYLIHKSTSARQILDATRRAAGVPTPEAAPDSAF